MAKELKHNKQHGIYAVIRANPVHYTHLDFYEVDLTYFTLISVPYYHPEKILQIYVYKRNLQRCFMYFNRYIMYIKYPSICLYQEVPVFQVLWQASSIQVQ